jgi:hypothetical protein
MYKHFSPKIAMGRPLDRSKRKWEDNIIMDLSELWCEDVE